GAHGAGRAVGGRRARDGTHGDRGRRRAVSAACIVHARAGGHEVRKRHARHRRGGGVGDRDAVSDAGSGGGGRARRDGRGGVAPGGRIVVRAAGGAHGLLLLGDGEARDHRGAVGHGERRGIRG